jgi:hypothetical protein
MIMDLERKFKEWLRSVSYSVSRLREDKTISFENRAAEFCNDQLCCFDDRQRHDARRIAERMGWREMWSLVPSPVQLLQADECLRAQQAYIFDESIVPFLGAPIATTPVIADCVNSPTESLVEWIARPGIIQIDCLSRYKWEQGDKSFMNVSFGRHELPLVLGVYAETSKAVYFGTSWSTARGSSKLAICCDLDASNKLTFFPAFMLQLVLENGITMLKIFPVDGAVARNEVLLYQPCDSHEPVVVGNAGVCVAFNSLFWMARTDDGCPQRFERFSFKDDTNLDVREPGQVRMYHGEFIGCRKNTEGFKNPARTAVEEIEQAPEKEARICAVLRRQCTQAEIKERYIIGINHYKKQFGSFGTTYLFNDRTTKAMKLRYELLSPHDVKSRTDYPINEVEWKDSMDVFYDAIFRFHYHLDKNSRRFIHEQTGDGNCYPLAVAGYRALTLPRNIRHEPYHVLRNRYCDCLLVHIDDGPKVHTQNRSMLDYFQFHCLLPSEYLDVSGDSSPKQRPRSDKEQKNYINKVNKNKTVIRRKFREHVNESRTLGTFNTSMHFLAVALYTKHIVWIVNFERGFSENMKVAWTIVPEDTNGVILYLFHDPQKNNEHYVTTVEMEDVGKYRAPDTPAENAETHDENGNPRSDEWSEEFDGKRRTRASQHKLMSAPHSSVKAGEVEEDEEDDDEEVEEEELPITGKRKNHNHNYLYSSSSSDDEIWEDLGENIRPPKRKSSCQDVYRSSSR